MAKTQKKSSANNSSESNNSSSSNSATSNRSNGTVKMKRTRKSSPREAGRSSVYRGVTRHRWTGRFEAHLWDKNCWNESQNKKGRQVYLGAYDGEEAAAHAYDLAAIKYWGQDTILNFPLSTYQEEMKEMEKQSKEEYIGSLRRKSSGFSRGVSKYRGVARHHHNGRWEARIGRVFGNKYLYLGTYATQEEAAVAYDMAAIEYRGLNAVTNFDLSRYVDWLHSNPDANNPDLITQQVKHCDSGDDLALRFLQHQPPATEEVAAVLPDREPPGGSVASSALSLLLQSSKFKEMLENTSPMASGVASGDSQPSKCSFPEDIQTYFDCQDDGNYADGIFGDLTDFFQCELNVELL